MKTLEETYDWVAIESGYSNKAEMFKEIVSNEDLVEFYMRLVATKYAEQAIDRCAATAEAFIGLDIDGDTDAVINEESILKVKEELK